LDSRLRGNDIIFDIVIIYDIVIARLGGNDIIYDIVIARLDRAIQLGIVP